MSRTYRRKKYIPEWVYTEWQLFWLSRRSGGRFPAYFRVNLEGEELEKSLIQWHSDGGENKWHNPPSWFVNMYCQRKFRRHQKKVINKIMKSGDFEDYVFLDPDNPDWKWD